MKLFTVFDNILAFRRRFRPRTAPPRGLLVVSSGGLGDTVLFSLVIEQFSRLAVDAEPVTLLVQKSSKMMGFLFPSGVHLKAIDFGRLRDLPYRHAVMDELYDLNFRLVVHTDYLRHPHLDEAMIAAASASESVAMVARGWPKYDRALQANSRMYDRLYDSGPRHLDKVRRWHQFAAWLNAAELPLPAFRIPPARLPAAAVEPAPLVIIQPFSAVREKQSAAALYRRIITSLPGGFNIAIAGTVNDRATNPEFEDIFALPNVTFDASTFEDLTPRLLAARLVISVDTACMHLAAVIGAPTLCLASAAYVGEIVPYDAEMSPPNVLFLYHDMPCRGCLGNCSQPKEDGKFACVARINADDAVAAVADMLDGN